jgi:hypothetical protein
LLGYILGAIMGELNLFFFFRRYGYANEMHDTQIHSQLIVVFDDKLESNQRNEIKESEDRQYNDPKSQIAYLLSFYGDVWIIVRYAWIYSI